ncbi:hypothetical protein SBA3_80025 [Candidatus Sulfopaludibacter sp. SbA3]|nr:hypothetical protein SBA3_80025 [Candidatus Sulfopaludibacter sp. SbA3]
MTGGKTAGVTRLRGSHRLGKLLAVKGTAHAPDKNTVPLLSDCFWIKVQILGLIFTPLGVCAVAGLVARILRVGRGELCYRSHWASANLRYWSQS